MGVVKDRHGTYYARKKVPKNLETAVAKTTDAGKPRVSWLKANTDAKLHLAKFDAILAEAAASIADRPLRTSLTQRELERMAAYHYALALRDDELARTAGFSLPQFNEEKANNAELLYEVRDALARGDIGAIEDFIGQLLDLSKINLDPAARTIGGLVWRSSRRRWKPWKPLPSAMRVPRAANNSESQGVALFMTRLRSRIQTVLR